MEGGFYVLGRLGRSPSCSGHEITIRNVLDMVADDWHSLNKSAPCKNGQICLLDIWVLGAFDTPYTATGGVASKQLEQASKQ